MGEYSIRQFPKTRIATLDVCAVGLRKHHIAALLEIDVSGSREKIRRQRKQGGRISFTAWLITAIARTLREYGEAGGYRKGKRKVVIFNDVHVSMIVEKSLDGQKIPVPLMIEKAGERSIESVTQQINDAREKPFTEKDMVLHGRASRLERGYYYFPGWARRSFWRYLLQHPRLAFSKMGNVSVTSVGMMGNANGWFIPIAVHPACFGIGGISKQPVVAGERIEAREIMHMTVLLDHDVIDGANMARFISDLTDNIEKGTGL